MKILLFGSIAAGKTTIAQELSRQHPAFEIISIDDFRKKHGDYTLDGEKTAIENFVGAIKNNSNQIIEASGLGIPGSEIYEKIAGFGEDTVLLIILYVQINEIKKRIKDKVWDTPFPGKQENLDRIIQTINFGIQFGNIPMTWSELPNVTILQIENKDIETKKFILKTINNYIKLKPLKILGKKNQHKI
ncbi:MAG: hypothetical protein DRJ05_08380 [Bacteroidetes bacterium]|nr:MAG: hypothetical protein DRJ05_08380 [Bacteroidota bacterium]